MDKNKFYKSHFDGGIEQLEFKDGYIFDADGIKWTLGLHPDKKVWISERVING